MTTPQEARELADEISAAASQYIWDVDKQRNVLFSLASQVEALTAQLDSYKKDAERYAKKYQHYHLGINGRICAVCDFDVTDPIHIRGEKPGIVAAITKGTAA